LRLREALHSEDNQLYGPVVTKSVFSGFAHRKPGPTRAEQILVAAQTISLPKTA